MTNADASTRLPAGNLTAELIDTRLVFAHGMAALVTVLIAIVFGILVSLQFFMPDYAPSWLTMAWGRMRYAHTQGIMLGWLGNAFLAFMYHAVPVLTGRQVTSPLLGRWLFGLWNFIVVLPGWLLVLSGISQPIEWAEFPWIVDAFVIAGLLLAAIQFLPPFLKNGLEDLYVSSWYIIGGLVFTLLAYPMGNIIPELVPGPASAAFTGLWIHDAVGLFVTPMALSILYFVTPATTGRPIFSHFLSMLGFWGLFFFYPLNGTHHYVFSAIPMAAQMGAIAASALLGVVVVIVVTNLLLSMRGAGFLPKDIGLRFVMLSTIFYLIVSVQGASQAQMGLNRVVHFTDWVIAHSHLAMLGFATFAVIGGIIHAWQRIPWARYNERALNWSFWLLVVGISIMFVDLTMAGLVQAEAWQSGAPWLESVQHSRLYWHIRTGSALPITLGFLLIFYGLLSGPQGAGSAAVQAAGKGSSQDADDKAATGSPQQAHLLRMSYRAAMAAGIVFFILSVGLLGFWPGRVLDEQIAATTPDNIFGLSSSEQRGRAIYAREGCAYCHTQQIRYTDADIERFGAPTLAWEGQFDTPHMWGTRRVGPDLSRAGGTRSADWQYAHLFAPRSVVPWSIMPSYAVFFDGAADKPRLEARDLVAYLESLGRARELAWPQGDEKIRSLYGEDKWLQMSLDTTLNTHPARAAPELEVPRNATTGVDVDGQYYFNMLCAGCHGQDGSGNGPGSDWLSPKPRNLTQHDYTRDRLESVLWQGIDNTAMPAWRDLPDGVRSALIGQVMSFKAADPEVVVDQQQLITGENVYRENCSQCHGDDGSGVGFAADMLPVAPSDFRHQRPSVGESVRVLNNGIDGTSMAPWTDRLSEDEILAVTHYLRNFYEGEQ